MEVVRQRMKHLFGWIALFLCHQTQDLVYSRAAALLLFPVILAADQTNTAFGVIVYQTNLDKIAKLTSHSAMAVSGPNCDLVNFTDYVQRNLDLYELRNDGMKLGLAAQANFCRNELANALRRGPFQVNVLLGGTDAVSGQSSLYWLDWLGTLQKVKYGCQGYATNFCLSIMDREYLDGMSKEAAIKIIEMCIHELHTRFVPNQPNFIIKCIDKDGVSVVKFGMDPADN
jgi:20S proteasome subunit beta 4